MEAPKNVTFCEVCKTPIPSAKNRKHKRYCSNKCRQLAYRTRRKIENRPVLSFVKGNNADLIKEVCRLYITDPSISVADVTFGKGAFWQKVPHVSVVGSDIARHFNVGVATIDRIKRSTPLS